MAREQRKLAAILAADVVGYSKLMGRDESGTLARLNAHRTQRLAPALARNGGRLINNTGDGAIVEFGSAVDALRAAIEFQQAMTEANREQTDDSRIVFRIGLHLGDLIVEGDNLYGDGVNVAVHLETEAKPGGIVVSRAVCEAVQDQLKASLHELGELALKNIERPIRAFAVNWAAEDWPAIEELSLSTSGSAAPPQPAASNRSSAPRLSIVVLPFINFGGDREHEYFVDGVTESLTTDLSRLSGMLVIGGSTAFAFKGMHVDVKQLGQELGVRYTLEGSVQRSGNRMRVHARLVTRRPADRSGPNVSTSLWPICSTCRTRSLRTWPGNWEPSWSAPRLVARSEHEQLNSLDLYFQGMSWILKGRTSEFLSRAHRYFEQALTLDPCNIDALVWKAHVEATETSVSATDDRAAQLAAAEAALTKALAQAPGHAVAHMWLGYVKARRTGRAKVWRSTLGPWSWTEIWAPRMRVSVWQSIVLVVERRPRHMSRRHSGSALVIRSPISG